MKHNLGLNLLEMNLLVETLFYAHFKIYLPLKNRTRNSLNWFQTDIDFSITQSWFNSNSLKYKTVIKNLLFTHGVIVAQIRLVK